jgi:hypothetical protein
MSATLTVPSEMVRYLRDGLHNEIGNAAQAISQVVVEAGHDQHPEWYREPLEHFDQLRALLDLIGWDDTSTPAEVRVNLREHQRAILAALGVEMIVATDDLGEATRVDAERATRGEPPQREATAQRVLALREFTSAVKDLVDTRETPEGAIYTITKLPR